ncbi:MAG: 7,8-didemethyl-8-hydroxy-5-deazariboflavin synthase subunit CofG [Candidatus Lokiarchaeota archaeon]|nr:7,8-didemethyl-8-hydroxy-5-deazariboflavin synthase subunit CofG [Candidatus Lokiarchaeota archaeon]
MRNKLVKLPSDLEEIFYKRINSKIREKNKLLKIFDLTGPKLSLCTAFSNQIFRKFNNGIISFSRNIFLPLTSYCRNNCRYCNFRCEETDELPFMTEQKVRSVLRLAEKYECKEALLTMGEKPEEKYLKVREALKELGDYDSTIEYLFYICNLIIETTSLLPHSNPGVMDTDELKMLKEVNASLGLMLENISPRLMEKEGPHENSPGKNPKFRIQTIENAGKLKIPFTTGILLGIGETEGEIIDSLLKIEEINRKYHHIQEIIIQGYSPKKSDKNLQDSTIKKPYHRVSILKIIKTIIVAKLITDIPIQTPPNLLNSYQAILLTGIDDWGGISPLTPDFINPDLPWPSISEIKNHTEEAGFELKERLPIYPQFINEDFMPAKLRKRILKYVNNDGLVK